MGMAPFFMFGPGWRDAASGISPPPRPGRLVVPLSASAGGSNVSCCHDSADTVNLNINLGDLVAALTGLEQRIMSRIDAVLEKIAEVKASQTELIKDVRRLIADGDTTAALASLDELLASTESLDVEVEAASPEPAPEPPTEEPPAEPTPAEPPAEPVA
jgi:hypothetical protein